MNIDVTTTPQALYPDGLQDSFTITNLGPWTVYLDSDTSINALGSYPLPPTGTIVWDEHRPLYALSAGNTSTLRMTRNSGIGDAARASTDATIYVSPLSTSGTMSSGRIECSAYQSLEIILRDGADGFFPDGVNGYSVYVAWFNDDGTPTHTTLFELPTIYGDGSGDDGRIVVRTPIRGSLCQVIVQGVGDPTNGTYFQFNVSATSRVYREGWEHGQLLPGNPWVNSVRTRPIISESGLDKWSDKSASIYFWELVNPTAFRPLYFTGTPNQLLTVTLRVGNPAPAAATSRLRISDYYQSTAILAEVAIPAATFTTNTLECRIPSTYPVVLTLTNPGNFTGPGTASNMLFFTWSDV